MPIQNSKGAELPRAYARDAEALAVVVARRRAGRRPRRLREPDPRRRFRAARTACPAARPARSTSPTGCRDTRTNETLEAVCIAPPASPVAGSTLLLTEGVIDGDGQHSAYPARARTTRAR